MLDSNLLLRAASAGNLSASADGASVDFGAGDIRPLTYVMMVPQATGTTPTLVMKVQVSGDGTNFIDFLTFAPNTDAPTTNNIVAAGEYFVTGMTRFRYRRFSAVLGGTTPNFGAVVVGPDLAGEYTLR